MHTSQTVEDQDVAGVIAPPPLIFASSLALGFGLEALLPGTVLSSTLTWSLGGVLLAAGLGLAAGFFAAFRRARTPVDPRKPTSKVVSSGPYRFSRNPGYLSLTLIYAGIAVVTSALWAFVPLLAALVVIDVGVIRREERYLEAKFGDEYRRYRARTRRWI